VRVPKEYFGGIIRITTDKNNYEWYYTCDCEVGRYLTSIYPKRKPFVFHDDALCYCKRREKQMKMVWDKIKDRPQISDNQEKILKAKTKALQEVKSG
jgi:hypothetical protein